MWVTWGNFRLLRWRIRWQLQLLQYIYSVYTDAANTVGVRLHLDQMTDIHVYANNYYTITNVGLEGGLDRAMAFFWWQSRRDVGTDTPDHMRVFQDLPKIKSSNGGRHEFPKASVIISRGPGVWYWVCEDLLVLLGGCLEACLEVCLVTRPLDAARVISMA